MPNQPVFAGLIVDENGNPVETAFVGDEPCYVVNDAGFRRHIPSEAVDRQVIDQMMQSVEGHEDLLVDQAAKMLGQDDIFSRAMLQNQFKNLDQQMDSLFKTGIPEEGRSYMRMMGFLVVINVHGDVVRVEQPGRIAEDDEGGDE